MSQSRAQSSNPNRSPTKKKKKQDFRECPLRFQYAIAGHGTVAVLGEGGDPREWQVAVLAVKPHSLGVPRRLFATKAPQEGLDVESIAMTAATVTWRTKHGLPGSAQR